MKKKGKFTFLKRITAMMLAVMCTFSLCQIQPLKVNAEGEQNTLTKGLYEVPIKSLVSAAPLPAVQTAFAGAFGEKVLLEVAEDGSMKATANCQNMLIQNLMGNDYYANVMTVQGAAYNSYKTEKSSLAFGSAETEDKIVPDEITFPLTLDENGSSVLTLTVDFMNNFLGGGSDYPTNVTLTLDLENAKAVKEEVVLSRGTYDVDVALYHATKDQPSMAAGAFTGKAKISVDKNVATMYVYTQELNVYGTTAYMQGIKVQGVDGNYGEGSVVSTDTDGNPTCFSFTLPSTEEFLNVQVNAMGRDMDGRIKVDYTTLKKTSEQPVEDKNDNGNQNEKKDEDKGNTDGKDTDSKKDQDKESEDVLKDGTYNVSVALYHATKNQLSMASSAILKDAKIVVKNQKATMTIYTQPMSFGSITASLQELKVADLQGKYTKAKIVTKDKAGNPTSFSFTLPHTESYLTLKVNPHVAMMGNTDLDARLFIDYKTLKKVNNQKTEDKKDNSKDNKKDSKQEKKNTSAITDFTVTGADDWSQVEKEVDSAVKEKTVTVKLKNTTKVSGEVLKVLKGQDKNLVVLLENGVAWTINGTKITGKDFNDIDLGVTLHANNIPDNLVKAVAADNDVLELSLNHEGEFGFEGTLTVALGSKYAGKNVKLYYYNKATGKMELMGTYGADTNGNVAFTFTHASDYVAVMENTASSQKSPDTGEHKESTALPPGICILGVIGVAVLVRKRRGYIS